MKVAIIANPHSGGKKGKRKIIQVKEDLRQHKVMYDIFETRYPTHAVELVKELDVKNYDAVVALGGDGTNYEVLNGLLRYHGDTEFPAMGIIPVGRGNSFAKDLDINTTEDGIAALVKQSTRAVDVCQFKQKSEPYYFINLMGFGFVTDAASTALKFKKLGDFSYVIGVLYRTLFLKFHSMELEIDGQTFNGPNCFVEFCNSRYTGGDMLMAPEAEIDDGLFDAVIVSPLRRLALLATFPKLFKGEHGKHRAVRFVKGKKAIVRTSPEKILLPDGEIFGTTPTEIEVLPRLVRYFS